MHIRVDVCLMYANGTQLNTWSRCSRRSDVPLGTLLRNSGGPAKSRMRSLAFRQSCINPTEVVIDSTHTENEDRRQRARSRGAFSAAGVMLEMRLSRREQLSNARWEREGKESIWHCPATHACARRAWQSDTCVACSTALCFHSALKKK